jgi:hypothetical protein
MVWPPTPPLGAQAASAPPKTAAPATSAAAVPKEVDGGWPRGYATASGGAVTVFQPQIASWDGQRKMVMYAAVSYSAKGAAKPALGTVRIEADSTVAVADRLVNFTDVKLTESNFPALTNDQVREVVATINTSVPQGALVIGLDRVLARLDKSQIVPKNVAGVKADPPTIFYSTSRAILVNLDDDVVWSPIKDNDLKFAVNTNWDLFDYQPTRTFYLRHNASWLEATDIKGPWKPAGKLPDAFGKLPADDNWKDVKAALPGRPLTSSEMPKVFVSTTPAEMILLQGPPNYLAVTGTKLVWVSNTESDVFRMGAKGPVYFLISGRWFTAADFNGPWTFATQNLPDDFKKIPVSHQRSRVLASVPGTDQAAEAVLLAQIPQTARIDKKLVKAPDVQYEGEPKFQPIEQTSVARATNTDKDIIKVGDLYYMCFDGVWFMGRSPNGPWSVTGSVPGQIYEIPVSSPAYNVTNVTVVEDNSDAVVFATAAAYTGLMVAWGCAVWGTGYYYPPYVGYGGFYPIYHPYYPTYGYHASYNPWTGTYSRGVAAYGPYGGAGVGARYNPRTGTYARGAAAYGPYGSRGVAGAYNPRTGASAATRQGSNVYGSYGQTGVQRGNDWASTSRVTNRATGTTTRATQGSGGGEAITRNGPQGSGGVARTGSGDVYAGHDGNVYKKNDVGGWDKYEGGGNWGAAQPKTERATEAREQASTRSSSGDSSTIGQLNRDSAARAEGAAHARPAALGRSGSSSSYRPSSGGSRAAAAGGGVAARDPNRSGRTMVCAKPTTTTIVMAALAFLAGARLASAQAARPSAADDTRDANLRAYVELLRSDLRTQKVAIITEVMQFTEEEDARFWPIYREYDMQLAKINDDRIAAIKEYAGAYEKMTNEIADRLARTALDLEARRQALKAQFYDRFKTAVSAKTAARFLQVDNQILLILDLQIASSLPIIQ